ncbi:imidazoleglycerol-phosphate dehydratase [Spirochaetia bacterium]|nr:imidazoleglycerol-phosphate dehydratase [Spirochaetia bacterium]
MNKRCAEITRKTNETDIAVKLNLDGNGTSVIRYPIGFMVHMLNTFARHGLFDLEINASGDIEVDQHHLVEDTGIALGRCFAEALGEKRGIMRAGSCLYPMDETLVRAAVDISGRPFFVLGVETSAGISGIPLVSGGASFQTDTIEDFWQGFVQNSGITLHLDILRGRSDHHKIEAMFKAVSRALREACTIDPRQPSVIPSTKGVLS